MSELVEVKDSVTIDKGCDHKPVAIDFTIVHALNSKGDPVPYRMVATRFACWKCEKLLPIDLKHLVIGRSVDPLT